MTLNVKRTVTVNGKQFQSLDELPPDIRALYDKAIASGKEHVTVRRIVINGQEVGGVDDLPADVRAALSGALGGPKQTTSAIVITVAILIALALLRLR
jgi:glutaredoxin